MVPDGRRAVSRQELGGVGPEQGRLEIEGTGEVFENLRVAFAVEEVETRSPDGGAVRGGRELEGCDGRKHRLFECLSGWREGLAPSALVKPLEDGDMIQGRWGSNYAARDIQWEIPVDGHKCSGVLDDDRFGRGFIFGGGRLSEGAAEDEVG